MSARRAAPRASADPAALEALVARVKFDDRGLVPVVAQEEDGTVLMVAWANRDALLATVRTGRATYWSRSRQAIWVKGDTSGHVQEARAMALDCDGDTVLYVVRQTGPACHDGHAELLLGKTGDSMADERFLAQLWATIESRKADLGQTESYTRQLLSNPSKVRRKVIEEAYEVNEAHQALEGGQGLEGPPRPRGGRPAVSPVRAPRVGGRDAGGGLRRARAEARRASPAEGGRGWNPLTGVGISSNSRPSAARRAGRPRVPGSFAFRR